MRILSLTTLTIIIFAILGCTNDNFQPEIINLEVPENVFAEQVVPIYFEIENPTSRNIEIRRVEFTFSSARGEIGDLNTEYAKTVVTSPSKISANSKKSYMFGFTVTSNPTLADLDYPVRGNIRVYWNVGTRNVYKKFNWAVRDAERVEDMPAARAFGSSGVIDEKIYTFGGWENVTNGGHREIFEYDIEYNEWDTLIAELPDKRIYTAAVSLGDKIYIFGGYDTDSKTYKDEVLVFDGNTISVDGSMTQPKAGVMTATDGINIYIFGGKTTGDLVLNTIEKYTPGTGSTAMTSTLQFPRHSGTAGIYDSKVYIIGGSNDAVTMTPSAIVEEFDIQADTISQIGDISLANTHFGSCVRDDQIFMFGGPGDYKLQNFNMNSKQAMILGRILENVYGSMTVSSEDAIFNLGGWAELGNLDMVHSRVYKYVMD